MHLGVRQKVQCILKPTATIPEREMKYPHPDLLNLSILYFDLDSLLSQTEALACWFYL